MEYGKQGSSETSSEENDRLEQDKDVKGNKRRCYECTFCKRGFTNAQALGGHMNIHRKDRAKTKQNISVSSFSEESMAPRFVTPISTQPTDQYHPVVEPQRDYYNSYLQPYSSGSSGYRSQSMTTNPELLGRNLSLSFNSAHLEDSQVRRGLGNCEEIDLELRLGHG